MAPDAGPVAVPLCGASQQARVDFYNAAVAPIFSNNCEFCHSGPYAASMYTAFLDVVPGDRRASLLASSVVDLCSPPDSTLITRGVHTGSAISTEDQKRVVQWLYSESCASNETCDATCPLVDFTPEAMRVRARTCFELRTHPVLADPVNLCINCHTYDYGFPRQINFLERDAGATMYESVTTWISSSGAPLYDVNTPYLSRLITYGQHGFSGVAPAFPADHIDDVIAWLHAERDAERAVFWTSSP